MPTYSTPVSNINQWLKPFSPAQRTSLTALRPGNSIKVISTAIQTANASVVLTASTELVVPFVENGTYILEARLALAVANAAHNIAFDFGGGTCTASAVGRSELQITAVASDRTSLAALTTLTDGGTTSAWTGAYAWLTVTVTAPGSLALRYRQSVSGASASSISIGSQMVLDQVA